MTKALTAKRIENENPGKIRKEIPDGLLVGLYLVVQPSGAKSFAVRYRCAGQPRKLTLGAFPAITLEAARDIERPYAPPLKAAIRQPRSKQRKQTPRKPRLKPFAASAIYLKPLPANSLNDTP